MAHTMNLPAVCDSREWEVVADPYDFTAFVDSDSDHEFTPKSDISKTLSASTSTLVVSSHIVQSAVTETEIFKTPFKRLSTPATLLQGTEPTVTDTRESSSNVTSDEPCLKDAENKTPSKNTQANSSQSSTEQPYIAQYRVAETIQVPSEVDCTSETVAFKACSQSVQLADIKNSAGLSKVVLSHDQGKFENLKAQNRSGHPPGLITLLSLHRRTVRVHPNCATYKPPEKSKIIQSCTGCSSTYEGLRYQKLFVVEFSIGKTIGLYSKSTDGFKASAPNWAPQFIQGLFTKSTATKTGGSHAKMQPTESSLECYSLVLQNGLTLEQYRELTVPFLKSCNRFVFTLNTNDPVGVEFQKQLLIYRHSALRQAAIQDLTIIFGKSQKDYSLFLERFINGNFPLTSIMIRWLPRAAETSQEEAWLTYFVTKRLEKRESIKSQREKLDWRYVSILKVGQRVQGKLGTHIIWKQLYKDVWTATSLHLGKVVIKTAPKHRLSNERDILKRFQSQQEFRQLMDETNDPPSLVLQRFDDNLLNRVLEALQGLHDKGYVHTDIKPDNILINCYSASHRIKDVVLADYGDACLLNDLKPEGNEHIIGAHMFRSPEAMLNMRWGTATDIWSFGATLISLIWGNGWHIFKPDPKDAKPDDPTYPNHVFVKQIAYFGPFPLSYFDILPEDDERWEMVGDST
ncbi:Protein kinase-like (PK-like) [Glarea lozoyensis ATCC 20868]|uniref:Protein kinase-like (PK-like) n=1 Tax=Glarea lozoyensis (strain ATCC 20868 / MF5171) TaxID=1116229 RepID=S3CL84_GLAL2|nr:Protein kinase-like (PK-like) [Glarea lozoyensis ATCC 20868]EPE26520.1 Protein kinase-like (PK-like) [Glarea lozoyensis ATCC 20868]